MDKTIVFFAKGKTENNITSKYYYVLSNPKTKYEMFWNLNIYDKLIFTPFCGSENFHVQKDTIYHVFNMIKITDIKGFAITKS